MKERKRERERKRKQKDTKVRRNVAQDYERAT